MSKPGRRRLAKENEALRDLVSEMREAIRGSDACGDMCVYARWSCRYNGRCHYDEAIRDISYAPEDDAGSLIREMMEFIGSDNYCETCGELAACDGGSCMVKKRLIRRAKKEVDG